MKAQCDACCTKTATVFCYVEEKALCSSCDHNIHNENSLAHGHQRISFFYPVPKQIPICDICQETKAFIFCKEHRSILCRTCDISFHSNDITKKHIRFILTGAKLSTLEIQVAIESGGSSSSSSNNKDHPIEMAQGTQVQGIIPNMSSDDPYGLCKVVYI
ncbi:hypothetical protein ACJIZ3_004952 [Penstemon smallii]|uniref:B box-type domain-containing protein n=1 Tax=Penstemon smallii TaxID=265156 RepID=A0ABD3S3M1_9LAMI